VTLVFEELTGMKKVIIGVLTAVLLIGLGGAAWFFLAGPGQRDVPDDGVDHSLTAVPADSVAYLGVTWEQLLEPDSRALSGQLLGGEEGDLDQTIAAWLAPYGVQFPQDFIGWIGESATVALLDLQRDAFTGELAFEWAIILESRNARKAEAFVEQVEAYWAANGQPDNQAIALTDRLLFLGSNAAALERVMMLESGASFADELHFQQLVTELPAERPFTFALQTDEVGQLLLEMALEQSPISLPNIPLAGFGLTVGAITLSEQAAQVDAYTRYEMAELTAVQQQLLQTLAGDAETAVYMPSDSLVYFNGIGTNLLWSLYKEAIAAEAGAEDTLTPIIQQVEQLLKVNLESDFLDLLDGETAVVLMQGSGGGISALAELGLDAAVLVDSPDMALTVQTMHDALLNGLISLGEINESDTTDGQILYQTDVVLLPNMTFNYGLAESHFLIGTSTMALEQFVYDQSISLADGARYQLVQDAFSAEMTPGLFVDVAALATHLTGQQIEIETAVFQQIESLGTAVSVDGNLQHTQVIINLKP
jgi:hypothetical protein